MAWVKPNTMFCQDHIPTLFCQDHISPGSSSSLQLMLTTPFLLLCEITADMFPTSPVTTQHSYFIGVSLIRGWNSHQILQKRRGFQGPSVADPTSPSLGLPESWTCHPDRDFGHFLSLKLGFLLSYGFFVQFLFQLSFGFFHRPVTIQHYSYIISISPPPVNALQKKLIPA